MVVNARQLALKPRLQVLRGYRRSLLLRLEKAAGSALENHANRPTVRGTSVLIIEGRYNTSRKSILRDSEASDRLTFAPLLARADEIENLAAADADLRQVHAPALISCYPDFVGCYSSDL